ncbi:MAG: endonuclease V [Hydrogenothermaceae bacterium]|nr:endonuclease V [Hydrogenothermaceae bacterium]
MDIQRFIEIQLELSKKLNLKDRKDVKFFKFMAGIDCTFMDVEDKTLGISCIVVMDREFNVLEINYGEVFVDVPYIPTFLAFREIPVVMEAYQKMRISPDVFIFDGQGILHPRKMGIASHFGIMTDTVTVGCGKSYLYGRCEEPSNVPLAKSPVFVDGEVRGYSLRVKKSTNPIFVSPGNNISLESSLYVIINSLGRYKLPEPIRLAHNLLKVYRNKVLEELR